MVTDDLKKFIAKNPLLKPYMVHFFVWSGLLQTYRCAVSVFATQNSFGVMHGEEEGLIFPSNKKTTALRKYHDLGNPCRGLLVLPS